VQTTASQLAIVQLHHKLQSVEQEWKWCVTVAVTCTAGAALAICAAFSRASLSFAAAASARSRSSSDCVIPRSSAAALCYTCVRLSQAISMHCDS
jgi:hypothetical protein